MPFMGQFQHTQQSRNTHRFTTHNGLEESLWLAEKVEKHLRRYPRRRALPPIIGGNLTTRGVIMEQEPTAADARGLRLHQTQNHLHDDGRVHGAAALAQDMTSRRRCMGVGRYHHEPFSGDGAGCSSRDADDDLGLGAAVRYRGAAMEEQNAEEKKKTGFKHKVRSSPYPGRKS